jgi:hypothetical protein
LVDITQITAEVEAAIARCKTAPGWEGYATLEAEMKAIAERHGVPFQDWGGYEDLKKQADELSKLSPEELLKRAAEIAKLKP